MKCGGIRDRGTDCFFNIFTALKCSCSEPFVMSCRSLFYLCRSVIVSPFLPYLYKKKKPGFSCSVSSYTQRWRRTMKTNLQSENVFLKPFLLVYVSQLLVVKNPPSVIRKRI